MLTPSYNYWQVMRWIGAYPEHGAGGAMSNKSNLLKCRCVPTVPVYLRQLVVRIPAWICPISHQCAYTLSLHLPEHRVFNLRQRLES